MSRPLPMRMTVLPFLVWPVLSLAAPHEVEWRDLLREPSREFTQMPFWFWNDELNDTEILRQMADFRAHGVYGFVIHARMGLSADIPFMGERWLHHVKTAVDEAAKTGMRVCLYDEGMYPSGSAHGEVVRANPAFAAQGLLMTSRDVTGPALTPLPSIEGELVAVVRARRLSQKQLDGSSLALVDPKDQTVKIPEGDWRLMIFSCVPSQGRIRGVHEGEDDRQPNAPAAADLLNPEAMKVFLQRDYDPYADLLREHLGKTVVGIFTDEPSMLGRGPRRGLKPWTSKFAQYFETQRHYSILKMLPALFENIGEQTGRVREDYERTLAERLDDAYYRQLSAWCDHHGIALTGHPAGANEIQPLRYFQIPGQDLVWRAVLPGSPRALEGPDSALPKCSSSVAHHDSRARNSDEIYGAYGWQLTMEEMKWLADWMMVRGVNLFHPHAFYYSIRGDRGSERPPDLGPHNLWWPHYKLFADYTARICGLIASSQQVCDVAILCRNNHLPWRAAKWLYQHQVDFNYLEEWRLLKQAQLNGGRLRVGDAAYRCVILDQDALPDEALATRLRECEAAGVLVHVCRGTTGTDLIEGLEQDLQIEPAAPDLRAAHLTREDLDFYYLVNEGDAEINTRAIVRRLGRPEWFDAWSGQFHAADVLSLDDQRMQLLLHLGRHESVILCVDRSKNASVSTSSARPAVYTSIFVVDKGWTVQDEKGLDLAVSLGDWLGQTTTSHFTGTLHYEARVSVHKTAGRRYRIDLGRVGDFAVVRLNGHDLGVRFWAPYAWDITDALTDGDNGLSVDVTNSLTNKYDLKVKRASGLMGPVTIEESTR